MLLYVHYQEKTKDKFDFVKVSLIKDVNYHIVEMEYDLKIKNDINETLCKVELMCQGQITKDLYFYINDENPLLGAKVWLLNQFQNVKDNYQNFDNIDHVTNCVSNYIRSVADLEINSIINIDGIKIQCFIVKLNQFECYRNLQLKYQNDLDNISNKLSTFLGKEVESILIKANVSIYKGCIRDIIAGDCIDEVNIIVRFKYFDNLVTELKKLDYEFVDEYKFNYKYDAAKFIKIGNRPLIIDIDERTHNDKSLFYLNWDPEFDVIILAYSMNLKTLYSCIKDRDTLQQVEKIIENIKSKKAIDLFELADTDERRAQLIRKNYTIIPEEKIKMYVWNAKK